MDQVSLRRMNTNADDILHCEEQLRNTLHCDNKEKLRRKLAQLQREYLKTAQRLQRAERLEAVRRHVRSKITQQTQQDDWDPEVTSNPYLSSSVQKPSNAADKDMSPCQGETDGSGHSSRKSQVIRFLLPSDAAYPQTPDPSHDRGHRSSTTLRLRSRRSRLRLERRSAEAGPTLDNTEQSESLERATIVKDGSDKSKETDVLDESEELFSNTDSDSPSLLLTHWSMQGHAEAGDVMRKELQKQKETVSGLEVKEKCYDLALNTEERQLNVTESGQREMERSKVGVSCRTQPEMGGCKENTEENTAETTESGKRHDEVVDINEEKNNNTEDGKSNGLLNSCTLVEGLLFPAEYYVRTTRRMTLSQSQPDMQAVILSQLSMGQHRRSRGRGRGRGSNRETHTQTKLSPPTITLTSPDLPNPPCVPATDAPAECGQGSSEIPKPIASCQMDSDACSSPALTITRPTRGRRKRRGRGRTRTTQSHLNQGISHLSHEQSEGYHLPTSASVSSSQSLGKDEGTNVSPHGMVPEPHGTQSVQIPATSQTSGLCSSVSGCLQIYPIFLKSGTPTINPPQMNRGTSSWPSLLLPPSSSPPQTSLLPLSSLSSGWLVSNMTKFDIHQDFHLPDDHFASLKLHKLHQVAVESELEHFSTPSRNTRSSILRHASLSCPSSGQLTRLHLPLSFTPTVSNSPAQLLATQHLGLQSLSNDPIQRDELKSESLAEELSSRGFAETDVNYLADSRQTETHKSTEPLSLVEGFIEHKGNETVTPHRHNQSQTSISYSDKLLPLQNISHEPQCKGNDCVIAYSGEPTACGGVVCLLQDQGSGNSQAENRAFAETPSFDYSPKALSNNCTDLQAGSNTQVLEEPPGNGINKQYSSEDNELFVSSTNLSADRLFDKKTMCSRSPPRISMSSAASAPCPFITPRLTSDLLLPSVGLTPCPAAVPQLSSSISAPSLILPPPHSPSTRALSPPVLSPYPSTTHFPPSLPPLSLSSQIEVSCEPPYPSDQCQEVEPAVCPMQSNTLPQSQAGLMGLTREETTEKLILPCTLILKVAAGGCLVDVCCVTRTSGDLCVAAAGKWAVCLWGQTSASDWSLIHTWTFREPVISVFPVPDAAGLICVTLGQLEIRKVSVLSCTSLMQMLVCEGVIQAVAGMSESRLVTSSLSASGSTLQVFTLSDSSSSPISQALVSPGVCVGALAPVVGLPDALIGTDECGHLFIWNLKTGQLLCRVLLGQSLSHTACLKGYSHCGALLVLLQHQFLGSMEEEDKEGKMKDEMFLEEEKTKTVLFSIVGINPLNGKSILATRLHPPKAWSGRLCESDVNRYSIVGLSQSSCLCVWEVGKHGTSQMVAAPEGEDWVLVRWGGENRLLIGHHNGDVSLHYYNVDKI